jgi:glycosyltransferase involved in cell wall biosynthesis
MSVTVAIPTLNGGELLERVLLGVQNQQLPEGEALELLVCDSGSCDGSAMLARRLGAEVLEVSRESFSHGATRNLLMEHSSGERVAFLTQDAVPAGTGWLGDLLAGFELGPDVALVFGPYRPRAQASPMVRRELAEWFGSFAPDGRPRVDRLSVKERRLPSRAMLGARAFFTDANGCVAKAAWQEIPFRAVSYAEDHVLAIDMLRAGYAKVFMPDAAVVHSHDYSNWDWLRRSFDEARALQQVYDWGPSLSFRDFSNALRGQVRADWRWGGATGDRSPTLLWRSTGHHAARLLGASLGSHSDHLPSPLIPLLSLEGRMK